MYRVALENGALCHKNVNIVVELLVNKECRLQSRAFNAFSFSVWKSVVDCFKYVKFFYTNLQK